MTFYDNSRSDDGPKKPIEVLNDRLDALINKFVDFNLAIAALTKRVEALESVDALAATVTEPTKARKRALTTTQEPV